MDNAMVLDRRNFFGMSAKTAMVLVSTEALLSLEGCDATSVIGQLETWVPVGLSAFDTIVSLINPAVGTALDVIIKTADNLWLALATAVANYQHTTDPTTTLLDKVIAALDDLQVSLANIVAALPVSIPAGILAGIKGGLALLIATLKSIRGKLQPSTPTPTARTIGKVDAAIQGVAPAESQSDFIKRFNQVLTSAGQKPRLK